MSYITVGADAVVPAVVAPKPARANWGKDTDPTSAVSQLKALIESNPFRKVFWGKILPPGQTLWNGLNRSKIEDKITSLKAWRLSLDPSNEFHPKERAPKATASPAPTDPPPAPAAPPPPPAPAKGGLDVLANLVITEEAEPSVTTAPVPSESVKTVPMDTEEDTADEVQSLQKEDPRTYFKWSDASKEALFAAVEASQHGVLRRVDWKKVVEKLSASGIGFPATYNTKTLGQNYKRFKKATPTVHLSADEEKALFIAYQKNIAPTGDDDAAADWDAVLTAMSSLQWPEGLSDDVKKTILQEKVSARFKSKVKGPSGPPTESIAAVVDAGPPGERLTWSHAMMEALVAARDALKSDIDAIVRDLDTKDAFKAVSAWTRLDTKAKKDRVSRKLYDMKGRGKTVNAPAATAPLEGAVQGRDNKPKEAQYDEKLIESINRIITGIRSDVNFMDWFRSNLQVERRIVSGSALRVPSSFHARFQVGIEQSEPVPLVADTSR